MPDPPSSNPPQSGSKSDVRPTDSAQNQNASSARPGSSQPTLDEGSKKKSRLQWDEENLMSNAIEMERAGPRMKIDEPKTPFVGSETGSSTSGSAHQSPPESPSFIPGEQLVGFQTLERNMRRGGGGTPSDGASSVGSTGRNVQISDDLAQSGGSSPRSREEFAAKRKAHYHMEARNRMEEWRKRVYDEEEGDDEGDGVEKEAAAAAAAIDEMGADKTNGENGFADIHPNGGDTHVMMNGHKRKEAADKDEDG